VSTGWKKKDKNNERGHIAIRYRAYPTDEQSQKAAQIDGCCRQIKNLAKEQRDLAYRLTGKSPGYTAQTKDLKELRDDPELAPWLSSVPSQILQQALRDRDAGYQRFFSGKAKYPTWAKKSSRIGFRVPQHVEIERISRRWGEVRIQGMGWIRIRMHRPPVGSHISSATYTREPDGKAFISILCERHKRQPTKPLDKENTTIGIDRGVAVAIATSDGDLINRENWTPKERERLVRLERTRERKKRARARTQVKGEVSHKSKRQVKTELAITALHARVRRRRNDFVEQVSYDLAKNHATVVFEDLHLAAMTRSAKGTIDSPGKNIRQKSGLNRVILDKALGKILTRTDDKAHNHGHLVLCVPAPGTSITCPECGYRDADNRASRSVFICKLCGHRAHADVNAAINIRERGIKLALAGRTPVAAYQGTNLEPASVGAEPGAVSDGRGSGNEKTGYITERVPA
jgi:transposase